MLSGEVREREREKERARTSHAKARQALHYYFTCQMRVIVLYGRILSLFGRTEFHERRKGKKIAKPTIDIYPPEIAMVKS